MKNALRRGAWTVGIVAALAGALAVWVGGFGQDSGPTGRPAYGAYTFPGGAPRGGPAPRADGYVEGSRGSKFILPVMPPSRPMDVHTAASVGRNNAIKTCFWPGPKLRPGFYTTDPDDYGIENQLPDTMNTFSTAWFRIPEGAQIVMKGEFPHERHWSFTTYSTNGVPRDSIDDIQIDPDPGSQNPFRPGIRRDVKQRHYTVFIANGEPPAQRAPNTVYTRTAAGTDIGMHMRNYVPDRSIDYLGGVAPPEVELRYADGRVLKGEEACAATRVALRGEQVPLPINPKIWQALTRLPWMNPAAPAHRFESEPMEMFFNREYLILKTFFTPFAFDGLAVQKGGFWSNLSTRYGYKFLSQAHGKVYAVRGKMPSTPKTWSGDAAPMTQDADMRYWSICSVMSPATGMTVDCVFDEGVASVLDDKGYFTIAVSRATDRPANATEKCGVVWLEWGNGDGMPGGSSDYGSIINRHTTVNPKFGHSWFAVTRPGAEAKAMGDYAPIVSNLGDKQRFEALGCPVDTSKIGKMAVR